MKRSILVATFLVTAAGVASAGMLTANSHSAAPTRVEAEAPRQAPRVAVARVEPTQAIPVASVAKAAPAPAPVVQKVSVETRQAPVPLQFKPRPTLDLPVVDAKATEAAPGETKAEKATDAASAEKAAKAAIEADGYKGVTVIRQGVNGIWHAKALRGGTPVMLTVDASGSVSSD